MKQAAVVGLGIGMAHCAGYLESNDARLVAVCDLLPERLSHVGGTFDSGSMLVLKRLFRPETLRCSWADLGVSTHTQIEEILHDPDIDIVSLCTPDHTHANLAIEVLRSGKHLLLEKPVALTLPDAQRVIEQARRSDLTVGVGYEFRLNPVVCRLRELVVTGQLGRVEAFSLYHFRTPFRRDKWQHWIQQKETSGGLIVEETSHWLDLLRFVTNREPADVHCCSADGVHPDFDYEDLAFLQGRFHPSGAWQISHFLTGFDFDLTITVHGTDRVAWAGLKEERFSSLDGGASDYLGVVTVGPVGGAPRDATIERFGEEATEPNNIRDCTKQFAAAVNDGQPPLVSLSDATEALRISLAAYESVARNEVIALRT